MSLQLLLCQDLGANGSFAAEMFDQRPVGNRRFKQVFRYIGPQEVITGNSHAKANCSALFSFQFLPMAKLRPAPSTRRLRKRFRRLPNAHRDTGRHQHTQLGCGSEAKRSRLALRAKFRYL
jgi:hypothetical protein